MTRKLQQREAFLQEALTQVTYRLQRARDKVTGKTRAQAAVRRWLEKLGTVELRHEAEIRGYLWGQFDSIEQAVDTIHAAMFSGVVVCGETMTFQPVTRHAVECTGESGVSGHGYGSLPPRPRVKEEGFSLEEELNKAYNTKITE